MLLRLGGIFQKPLAAAVAGMLLCIASVGVFVTAVVLANNDRLAEVHAVRRSMDAPPTSGATVENNQCSKEEPKALGASSPEENAKVDEATKVVGASMEQQPWSSLFSGALCGADTDDDTHAATAIEVTIDNDADTGARTAVE